MEEKQLIKIFEKLVEDCNRVSEGMQYEQDLQILSKARKALNRVKKNGVLHSVSDMFSFASFLYSKYNYYSTTEEGNLYVRIIDNVEFTEVEVWKDWKNYR